VPPPKIVLDSNIFVGAAFNPASSSARLLAWVREGRLRLIWHELTLAETRYQLEKIPPLAWEPVAGLFESRNQFREGLPLAGCDFIPDPDDRKFAALAEKADALLVTNDEHLLAARDYLNVPVLTPRDAVARLG
jgi:predicted nucleic acid-binding protein